MTKQQLDFLQIVVPQALEQEALFEIPAAVTIAQAILESATAAGWGTSDLFKLANNPFGIKYSHMAWLEAERVGPNSVRPAQPGVAVPPPTPEQYGAYDAVTWEIVNGQKNVIHAEFQRYPRLEEGFTGHSLLLRAPHYAPAYALRKDWKEFAERLGPKTSPSDSEHCGYSTNPSYSAELIKIVNLYRLDDKRAQQWYCTGKDPALGAHSLPTEV